MKILICHYRNKSKHKKNIKIEKLFLLYFDQINADLYQKSYWPQTFEC